MRSRISPALPSQQNPGQCGHSIDWGPQLQYLSDSFCGWLVPCLQDILLFPASQRHCGSRRRLRCHPNVVDHCFNFHSPIDRETRYHTRKMGDCKNLRQRMTSEILNVDITMTNHVTKVTICLDA